jgi:hypothetical protein
LRLKSHTRDKQSIYNNNNFEGKEVKSMKIVNLCTAGSCCPVLKLTDEHVEIGEEGNLCVLTYEEWESLKSKVANKEV